MSRVFVRMVSLLGLAALAAPAHNAAAAPPVPPSPQLDALGPKVRELTRKELHTSVDAKLGVMTTFGAPYLPKVQSTVKSAGFDSAGYMKAIEALESAPLTPAMVAGFAKSWDGKLQALFAASGTGIQDNSRGQLAAKLDSTLIGKMLSFVTSNRPMGPFGGSGGGDDKHGPPMLPHVTQFKIRLNTVLMPSGGLSSPDGLLHVHAMTHNPAGVGVESYAALAGELAIQGGTTGVSISVPARTVVSLALATTAPGHAIAQSSVRLRVMELHDGTLGKELCSGGMLVSSAEAVVTGLAGQEAHNQANVISCRWRRDTTVAARAVVIFEETGYAVVHGIGAAHALLDTMIDLVDVASERP